MAILAYLLTRRVLESFVPEPPRPVNPIDVAPEPEAPEQNQLLEDVKRKFNQLVFDNPLAREVTNSRVGRGIAEMKAEVRQATETAKEKKERFVAEAETVAEKFRKKGEEGLERILANLPGPLSLNEENNERYTKKLASEIEQLTHLLYSNPNMDDGGPDDGHPIDPKTNPQVNQALIDFTNICEQTLKKLQPKLQLIQNKGDELIHPTPLAWKIAISDALESWLFSMYIEVKAETKIEVINANPPHFDLLCNSVGLRNSCHYLFPAITKAFKTYLKFVAVLANDSQPSMRFALFAHQLIQERRFEEATLIVNRFVKDEEQFTILQDQIAQANRAEKPIQIHEEKKE